jgi:hypothetical protein
VKAFEDIIVYEIGNTEKKPKEKYGPRNYVAVVSNVVLRSIRLL